MVADWWREGHGGVIMVRVYISHAVFASPAAGHNEAFAMPISGGSLLLVGILFLLHPT
jgi:hypothetical protein